MTTPAAPRLPSDASPPPPAGLFPGASETARRCRAHDWAATPLGPAAGWPAALRAAVQICLDAGLPSCVYAGDALVMIYNDGFAAILGQKHPGVFGCPARDALPEIWDEVGPELARVHATGAPVFRHDARYVLARGPAGAGVEGFYTFAFSPVRDDAGAVVAIHNVVTETTGRVRAERALTRLIAASPAVMAVYSGPEHVLTYVNPTWARVVGKPGALGRPFREVFPEMAGAGLLERLARVYATGEPYAAEELRLPIQRRPGGPVEESYWSFVWEPAALPDTAADGPAGAAAGRELTASGLGRDILCHAIEVTAQVRARRGAERLLAASEAARADAEQARADAERAAAALVESETRFRTVQDASPMGFAIHRPVREGGRPDGRVVDFTLPYVNEAGARIVGHPRERLLAGTLLGIWPGTGPAGVFADYVRVLETGDPRYRELLYEHDGLAAGLTLAVVRIGTGADAEVGVTFTDVTARLRADAERARLLAELGAERERLRSVILHMPSPLALHVGPEHRFELINDAFRRISGGGRDDTGLTVREAFPELAGQGIIEALDRVWATGEPWVGAEVPIRYDRDGTGLQDTWYNVRYEPVRDAAGAVWGVLNFAVDVTDQVRARRATEGLLAESERARAAADLERRRLETVLQQLPVGVHVAEAPGGRLVLDNAAIRAICGEAPRSEHVERYSADYAGHYPAGHPRAGEPLASDAWPLARALATGAPVGEELVEIRRADGTSLLAGVSAAPVRDAEGRVVGAVATSVDVTERERLLAEAEAARRAAEAANRAKGEFLAVMSHELRTPLNAIGGYAELIELGIHGPVTEAQRTALERIQRSQRHLLGLIAGVLDYSRVEAGAVTYRLADVPVTEAVAEAELLVAPQLRAKGLGYAWSGASPDLRVRADREKLQQILLNLLGNAVKFTNPRDGRPGRIEVACTVERAAGGTAGATAGEKVRIHVRDTGEGIAVAELERIFEPFVQADQRLTRPHAGVGLGLAISRDLARGMGGELTVESAAGQGSAFTLTLPRA